MLNRSPHFLGCLAPRSGVPGISRSPRILIGLTGGLGTGKTTALAELARLGAATASADAVAHALSGPGGKISRAVRQIFGAGYLRADGCVDRPALARLVFAEPAARKRLERATHPLIIGELRRAVGKARGPVAVVDAPLLFEAGMAPVFDVTVTVSAPRHAALRRVRTRGDMSGAEASRRMDAQWPLKRKEAAADVVWRNTGRRADFLKQVRQYYRAWDLIARSRGPIGRRAPAHPATKRPRRTAGARSTPAR